MVFGVCRFVALLCAVAAGQWAKMSVGARS